MAKKSRKRKRFSRAKAERSLAFLLEHDPDKPAYVAGETNVVPDNDVAFVSSLLNHYKTWGYLSLKQWEWVVRLAERYRRKDTKAAVSQTGVARRLWCWHVYVISDAQGRIKIGQSTHPKARLKALQTGHPDCLSLVWVAQIESKAQAVEAERQLHRLCAEYRLRGEWFDPAALNIIHGAFPVGEGAIPSRTVAVPAGTVCVAALGTASPVRYLDMGASHDASPAAKGPRDEKGSELCASEVGADLPRKTVPFRRATAGAD